MIKLILAICLILFEVCSFKVFLIGGALADNQTDVFTSLAAATGKKPNPNKCGDDWKSTDCPKIAIVTSAAQSEADGNQAYLVDLPNALSYKSLFTLYGFSPKHISVHIDNYRRTTDLNNIEGQLNLDILKQADVIYFNGGDQSRHSRSWLTDDGAYNQMMKAVAERAQRNQVVLVGTSAGSMIMCTPTYGSGLTYGHLYFAAKVGLAPKKVSDGDINGTHLDDTRNGTKGLQYEDNGGMMPGFNFVPFLVDTHVNARGRLGRIVPAMIQTKFDFGVGVEQSTAFYLQNSVATVYGRSGAYVVDISNASKVSKEYFAANNVLVSYLTSDDSYDFKTKKVIAHSSKTRIDKPAYSGHLDSTDIFSQDETTKILTRLGDQTSTYNVGKSRIPTGYPSNAPVFRLTFEKTSAMSSYWSSTQRKYTIAHATVHFAYQ